MTAAVDHLAQAPGAELAAPRPFLESALRGIAVAPFRVRRQALRLFFLTFGRPLLGRPHPQMVRACSLTLSLSRRDSEQFLRRSLFHDVLFQMEWLALAYRSKAGLIRDTRFVSVDRAAEIAWLASQRGAVLGTMHYGPYSLGLVWLFHRYFVGRTVIVVKSAKDDADERAAIARLGELGVDLRFVAPDRPENFFQLVKLVREGAFAIVMVDLPPSYGRSATADALGHELRFASGATDLAALCGVPIVLFRTCSDTVRDRIEIADIFEVRRNDESSRKKAEQRVSRFIRRAISARPDHWHMWTRFGEYLAADPA